MRAAAAPEGRYAHPLATGVSGLEPLRIRHVDGLPRASNQQVNNFSPLDQEIPGLDFGMTGCRLPIFSEEAMGAVAHIGLMGGAAGDDEE